MAPKPEEQARSEIDRLLARAGWAVQSMPEANIRASCGVALREFPLNSGFGFADYMLYVDGKAADVIVQEEIVAEIEKQFSRLDEAVANLKRVKANLRRYKAASFPPKLNSPTAKAAATKPVPNCNNASLMPG